jgi:hypothetical protein
LAALSLSMAAWQAAVTGVLAVEVAVGVVMALALLDVEPVEPVVDEVDPVVEEVLPMAAAVTVTVAVWVTVAVSVTVFVTVATGLAVVVGMSGMHSEMKIGSAVSTVCTPS